MKSIFLAIIFAVHAIVFARVYLTRGRRAFNLLLVFGFLLLLAYYGVESWNSFDAAGDMPVYFGYLRWAGIALCTAALPLLLTHLTRSLRAKAARRGASLDSKDSEH